MYSHVDGGAIIISLDRAVMLLLEVVPLMLHASTVGWLATASAQCCRIHQLALTWFTIAATIRCVRARQQENSTATFVYTLLQGLSLIVASPRLQSEAAADGSPLVAVGAFLETTDWVALVATLGAVALLLYPLSRARLKSIPGFLAVATYYIHCAALLGAVALAVLSISGSDRRNEPSFPPTPASEFGPPNSSATAGQEISNTDEGGAILALFTFSGVLAAGLCPLLFYHWHAVYRGVIAHPRTPALAAFAASLLLAVSIVRTGRSHPFGSSSAPQLALFLVLIVGCGMLPYPDRWRFRWKQWAQPLHFSLFLILALMPPLITMLASSLLPVDNTYARALHFVGCSFSLCALAVVACGLRGPAELAPSPLDPTTKQAGPQELCVICTSEPREVRFGCGHALCCEGCANRMAKSQNATCPICRIPFTIVDSGPHVVSAWHRTSRSSLAHGATHFSLAHTRTGVALQAQQSSFAPRPSIRATMVALCIASLAAQAAMAASCLERSALCAVDSLEPSGGLVNAGIDGMGAGSGGDGGSGDGSQWPSSLSYQLLLGVGLSVPSPSLLPRSARATPAF